MTRLNSLAIGLAVIVALAAVIYVEGRRAQAARDELNRARNNLETRERIDDALADCAGRPWLERLRGCD